MTDSRFQSDEWKIIETRFEPDRGRDSESIFALGNGMMGQRANFEERYSGDTLQGTYIAGIYYPDKTRVGWWKNGYPEYFAKVPNAPNWIGIHVHVDGEDLDLHTCKVSDFIRELNMKQGYLERSFTAELKSGKKLQVKARRFLSMVDDEIGAIRYAVKPLNFSGDLEFISFIEGNVVNRDSNYDEKFWDVLNTGSANDMAYLHARTRKSAFEACFSMMVEISVNGKIVPATTQPLLTETYAGILSQVSISSGEEVILYKYAAVLDSLNYAHDVI